MISSRNSTDNSAKTSTSALPSPFPTYKEVLSSKKPELPVGSASPIRKKFMPVSDVDVPPNAASIETSTPVSSPASKSTLVSASASSKSAAESTSSSSSSFASPVKSSSSSSSTSTPSSSKCELKSTIPCVDATPSLSSARDATIEPAAVATVAKSLTDKESAALALSALSALSSGRNLLAKFETIPISDNDQPHSNPDTVSSTSTTVNIHNDQRAVSPNSVVTFNDLASIDTDTSITENSGEDTNRALPSSTSNSIPIDGGGSNDKNQSTILKRKSISTASPIATVSPTAKKKENKRIKIKHAGDKPGNDEETVPITQCLHAQETMPNSPVITPSSLAQPVLKGNITTPKCEGSTKMSTPLCPPNVKQPPYALQHQHYHPAAHHVIAQSPQNSRGHFIVLSTNNSTVTTPYPFASYRKKCEEQQNLRQKADEKHQQDYQPTTFIRYNGAYICRSSNNRYITTANKNSPTALAHVTPSPHRNASSAGSTNTQTSNNTTTNTAAMFCRTPSINATPSGVKYTSSQPSPSNQLSGTPSRMHGKFAVSSTVKPIGSHNVVTPNTLTSGTHNNPTQLGILNHCGIHTHTHPHPTPSVTTVPPNMTGNLSNSGNYSRKDKSLGVLCENFMRKYASLSTQNRCFTSPLPKSGKNNIQKIGIPPSPPAISIDVAAKSLRVERRRIYDIINILEAIRVVSRKCKNTYYWHGTEGLLHTFQCMQKDAIKMWREDAIQNGLLGKKVEVGGHDDGKSVETIVNNGLDENSHGVHMSNITKSKMKQQQVNAPESQSQSNTASTNVVVTPSKIPSPQSGLAMLLASAEHVEVGAKTMKTITETKYSSNNNTKNSKHTKITTPATTTTVPTTTTIINQAKGKQKPKEKSLGKLSQKFIQLFLVGHTVIALTDASDKILGPTKPVIPCKGASKAEESLARAKASRSLKTKIRRLYDIANVLVSIGLIEKLNGGNNMSNSLKHRPSFRWIYGVSPQALLKQSESRAISPQIMRKHTGTHQNKGNSTHNKDVNLKQLGHFCDV